jgi:hypothetical protein
MLILQKGSAGGAGDRRLDAPGPAMKRLPARHRQRQKHPSVIVLLLDSVIRAG